MATLYDKDGKEYNVPHTVDIKEWLKEGYSLENPKGKVDEPMTQEEFDKVRDGLLALKADELKRVAKFMDVEYTNMKDTIAAIEDKLSL